jgi:hypothetical protein
VNQAEMNFAVLPDPVAAARGSDTSSKSAGYSHSLASPTFEAKLTKLEPLCLCQLLMGCWAQA